MRFDAGDAEIADEIGREAKMTCFRRAWERREERSTIQKLIMDVMKTTTNSNFEIILYDYFASVVN